MRFLKRRKMMDKVDNRHLGIAVIFLICALVSALVRADVKSVEGLEFSRVQLLGDNQLELTQDDDTVLKIRGDGSDLDPLPFVVQDDTLLLGVSSQRRKVDDVMFKLTTATLEALVVKGSGEAFVKPLVVEDLLVSLEGSGTIRMFDVQARKLEMRVLGSGVLQAVDVTALSARLNLKGSGDIQLGSLNADEIKSHMAGSGDISLKDDGKTSLLEVAVMGSGDVDLKDLKAVTASVTIMGSGDVELSVEEELEVEILGSGDLVYHGNPKTDTAVMGSGDITQRD